MKVVMPARISVRQLVSWAAKAKYCSSVGASGLVHQVRLVRLGWWKFKGGDYPA